MIFIYNIIELINVTVQHGCEERQPWEVDGTSAINIRLVKCRLGGQRQEKMDGQ